MKNKTNIYNFTLITIAFLITIVLYNKLPDLMPIHWNLAGEIDNYASKPFAAFLSPLIMIVLWIGMLIFPKIDPKKDNYSKFNKSYSVMISLMLTFFFIIHIITLGICLGYDIPIDKSISFMLGILFVSIGNYLPKSKSNFFYGIKTPWTLSSSKIWNKTHRLGGKLFVLSGLIITASSLLVTGKTLFIILMISISIASLVPVIASYFYCKNIQNYD